MSFYSEFHRLAFINMIFVNKIFVNVIYINIMKANFINVNMLAILIEGALSLECAGCWRYASEVTLRGRRRHQRLRELEVTCSRHAEQLVPPCNALSNSPCT